DDRRPPPESGDMGPRAGADRHTLHVPIEQHRTLPVGPRRDGILSLRAGRGCALHGQPGPVPPALSTHVRLLSMLRKILKAAAFGMVGLALAVGVIGVLYLFFGLRVKLDGGGQPHLTFVESAESRAKIIARHREAQRAQFGAGGPTPAEPPAPQAAEQTPPDGEETAPKRTVSAGPTPYWTDFRGPGRDG